MSSTNRNKNKRHQNDFYETPSWCVRAIRTELAHCLSNQFRGEVKGYRIVDAGAGTGAITNALYTELFPYMTGRYPHLKKTIANLKIHAIENDMDLFFKLINNLYNTYRLDPSQVFVSYADYLEHNRQLALYRKPETIVIGNPPYNLAKEFIKRSIHIANHVWLLLRLDFLGSKRRGQWYRAGFVPDVYVLEKRPSFTDDGKTDSNNYAWMHWSSEMQTEGKIRVLEC